MKTIKFIILVLAICLAQKTQAQTQGSYITNNTMGAFHGTWQWVSGTDTLKIYLVTKKAFYPINDGFHWDRLCGWHIYKRGNNVISSSYGSINNVDARTISLGNEDNPVNVVGGWIKDVLKNKSGNLTLTLNATQNQLTWHLEVFEGLKLQKRGDPLVQPGFTFPENIVLNKL